MVKQPQLEQNKVCTQPQVLNCQIVPNLAWELQAAEEEVAVKAVKVFDSQQS